MTFATSCPMRLVEKECGVAACAHICMCRFGPSNGIATCSLIFCHGWRNLRQGIAQENGQDPPREGTDDGLYEGFGSVVNRPLLCPQLCHPGADPGELGLSGSHRPGDCCASPQSLLQTKEDPSQGLPEIQYDPRCARFSCLLYHSRSS